MPRQRLVSNDPTATGVPVAEGYIKEAIAKLPRSGRKFAQKRILKLRQTTIQRVITEADIPPGSVISDQTLEAIRAGAYAMAEDKPMPSGGLSVKEKQAMARHDRMVACHMKQPRIPVEPKPEPEVQIPEHRLPSPQDLARLARAEARRQRRRQH